MAQALDLIKAVGVLPGQICQLCTDSVLFQPANCRKRACLAIADTTFKSLKRQRLIEPCGVTSTDSEELVYRVEEKDSRLRGVYKLPVREHQVIALTPREWRDVDPFETVAKGQGLYIQGIAGTGKSWLARQLVDFLRGIGQDVMCIAKTHTAAINIGGCTANHFCFKHILHGGCKAQWIVLDEVSQLELGLWIQLQKLCYTGTKFIVLGDFNQFPPISGHVFGGKILDENCIENSVLIKIKADCNRVCLTECKRSDQPLFDFYSSLIPGGDRYTMPFGEVLVEARKSFPRKRGFADF